jgi:hypothetical protein
MADEPLRHALVVRGCWEGHAPVAATELFMQGSPTPASR